MIYTHESTAGVSGSRSFNVVRGDNSPVILGSPVKAQSLRDVFRHAMPITGIREVDAYRFDNRRNSTRGLARIAAARLAGAPTQYGVVSGVVFRDCEYDQYGFIKSFREKLNYGVLSFRVVTTVGVNYIVDAFQNSVELENMKYHGFGTGGAAEAAANTALTTELTTEYATDSQRPTGSTTEGASENIYRTVGTLSPDASCAITEHGIFSANANGVMLDRSLFSAINLISGDSLQVTYDLTFTAGS